MSDNNLLINIRANADQMHKEFAKAKTSISDLAGVFGTIGTAAAGVTAMLAGGAMFKDMISTTKDVTAEVVKLSKTFGISAEQASVLRVALDDAMISTDDAVAASDRLTRASIKNADAFKTAGVDVRDSNGNLKDSMTVMMEVNDYLKTLKEGKDRDTAAMALYGKGWRELSGILRLTTDGMKEAEGRAKELHLIFGEDRIKAVKDYKLAMKDLDDVAESFKVQIGQELLPVLTQLAVAFGDIGTSAADGTGNILKEKLRDYKDFNAGVSQILRDIGIRMDGGSFGSRWITKEGRAEVKAELEASEQLYKWQMEKNAEKYGSSIKAVKKPKSGNRLGGKDTNEAVSKVDKDAWLKIHGDDMKFMASMYDMGPITGLSPEYLAQKEADYIKFLTTQADMGPQQGLSRDVIEKDSASRLKNKMGWLSNQSLSNSITGAFEQSDPYKQIKLQYDGEVALSESHLALMEDLHEAGTETYSIEMEKRRLIDERYAADKKRLDADMWMAGAASVASSVGIIGNTLMQGNKRQFEMGKQMAIASASISMIEGSINAFTAMSKIPYVGPFLGAAAAAAVIVSGTAKIAQIESMQYQPRALGGTVNPHSNYLVGEKGPELIRLGSHGGAVIPNNRLGGSSVSVTPVFQISTGVSDTVRAEIMQLAPYLTQMSVDAVHQAINSGGEMSAAVGRM